VTDALVALGYLSGESLLGGRMQIRRDLALEALDDHVASRLGLDVMDAALGVIQLVTSNMVDGIRMASIERGYDPRDFALVVGGGAGPAFGGLLGADLGIDNILVPKAAGALCAFGEAVADLRYDAVRSYPVRLADADPRRLSELLGELESEGASAFAREIEGRQPEDIEDHRVAEMKYVDQVHYCDVAVPIGPLDDIALDELRRRFHDRHEQLYSFSEPDNEPEIVSLRVSTIVRATRPDEQLVGGMPSDAVQRRPRMRDISLPDRAERTGVPVIDGTTLVLNESIEGPAIVEEVTTTILVLPGSTITLRDGGVYVMTIHDPIEFRRTGNAIGEGVAA
jgi:N-methylhydantoinase A